MRTALKETFKIGFIRGSIATTYGGVLTYLTFFKSMGMTALISVLLGLLCLVLFFSHRYFYLYGQQEITQDAVKKLDEEKTELDKNLSNITKHFINSMDTLNNCFDGINTIRTRRFNSDLTSLIQEIASLKNIQEYQPNLKPSTELNHLFIVTLEQMSNHLKTIFEKNKGNKYSVSIKLPVHSSASLTADSRVMNVARDSVSDLHRDTYVYKNTYHTISGNTCFNNIFQNIKDIEENLYYINNNIPASNDYKTTSKPCYENKKLPYDSELVVAITSIPLENEEAINVLGFLCIDCNSINGFDEDLDPVMMRWVADGINDVVEFFSPHVDRSKFIATDPPKKKTSQPKNKKRR